MTAQDLKNSVLQLAMQGKLVNQRAEEGTARELIGQIDLEKERLTKEGKLKKEKPLPKIAEEEIPYEIPESWEWIRLGNCISLLSGQDMTPDKYNDSERGIPYLTGASNIENGKIIINRWTDEPKAIATKGNLLITCKGTIGATCILTEKEVHIARQIMAITAICIEIEYIHKFLQLYVGKLKKRAKSMIPGIERKDVLNAVVPLPPLSEQKRIVAKIEELLPHIEKYDKAYSKLEELNKKFPEDMQKSILQYAMQGKLVEQRSEEGTGEELYQQIQTEKEQLITAGKIKEEKSLAKIAEDEIPFDIPASWKWVRLSEVVDVRDGTHDSPRYYETGIPLVTSKNISRGGLSFDNVKYISREDAEKINERSNVDTGDILFAMIGSIGNPVIVNKDRDFCVKNVALFKVFSKEKLCVEYLYWFLFLEQFVMKKIASGGVQSFIALKVFRNYLFPLPPYKEQKRIVEKLKDVTSNYQKYNSLQADNQG